MPKSFPDSQLQYRAAEDSEDSDIESSLGSESEDNVARATGESTQIGTKEDPINRPTSVQGKRSKPKVSFNLAIQQAKATPSQHSPPDEKGQHQKDRPIELPPISTLSAPGTSLSSSNANAFQSDISPILAHRTVTPQIPPVIQPTGQGNRQPTFPRQNSESSPQLESSNHTFRANTSSSVVCPVRALPVPVTNRPFPPPHFPPPNRPLPLPPSPSGTKTSVSNHPTIDNVEEEASLFLRSIIPSAYRHYTPTEGLPTVEQSLLVSARDYIEDLEDVARQGVNGTRPEGFGEKGEYLREWDFRGKMGAMKRRRRE